MKNLKLTYDNGNDLILEEVYNFSIDEVASKLWISQTQSNSNAMPRWYSINMQHITKIEEV